MHMLRNAIDHGIEHAEQRRKVGKPEAGTIALNAYQQGSHAMIEIEDDGPGIDEQALLAKASQLGKIDPGEQVRCRDEVLALIFPARALDAGFRQRRVGARRRHGHRQDEHRQDWRRDRRPE